MTKLLVVATLLFAACSDTTPASTATGSASSATGSAAKGATAPGTERPAATAAGLVGGPGEPPVDPTIPSWAPKSCIAYHKAVVQAIECAAIGQGKRDSIQNAYGTASEGWKAETNGTPERVEAVGAGCERNTATVRAELAGKCEVSKT